MPTSAPNTIVILSDQLRRGVLAVYGERNIQTPHIDLSAESGKRWSRTCALAGRTMAR